MARLSPKTVSILHTLRKKYFDSLPSNVIRWRDFEFAFKHCPDMWWLLWSMPETGVKVLGICETVKQMWDIKSKNQVMRRLFTTILMCYDINFGKDVEVWAVCCLLRQCQQRLGINTFGSALEFSVTGGHLCQIEVEGVRRNCKNRMRMMWMTRFERINIQHREKE